MLIGNSIASTVCDMQGGVDMEDCRKKITFEQMEEVIDILNPTIDDYIYIFDIQNDVYCISENALERFPIPSKQFANVTKTLKTFVYPNDWEILKQDLDRIVGNETKFHNLQYRWLDKEGSAVWINCRGRVICDDNGEPEFLVGCINEIGKKQKADNVSGLLRESSLKQEFRERNTGFRNGFILRLGIDNFKEINENCGMEYGDMILRKTAECIGAVIRPEQKLYRIVADEFIVLDCSKRGVEEALRLFNKIRWKISLFIGENQYEVFFTLSAGILEFSSMENWDYLDVMKWTEFALNEAKNSGKNKAYVFNAKDYEAFLYQRRLIHIMRQSVNHNFKGFEAHFQPIVDMKEGRLASAETLLRFNSEETGPVPPAQFIPLLEESSLIIPVGKWVLHQAIKGCAEIQKTIPDFRVSVNISYIQVLKSDILKEILTSVKRYGVNPGSIIIELTESGFLEADDNFLNFCGGLQENGIPLALDDFGTGYSNFHYLYNLNPNTIKIDRTFTLKALKSNYEYNLLRHMVDMTHSIDLKLCIEGIETEQELKRISEMGPDYIQGYYFGKPCSLKEFLKNFVNV